MLSVLHLEVVNLLPMLRVGRQQLNKLSNCDPLWQNRPLRTKNQFWISCTTSKYTILPLKWYLNCSWTLLQTRDRGSQKPASCRLLISR